MPIMETFSPLRPSVRCGTGLSAACEALRLREVMTVTAAAFFRKCRRSIEASMLRVEDRRGKRLTDAEEHLSAEKSSVVFIAVRFVSLTPHRAVLDGPELGALHF